LRQALWGALALACGARSELVASSDDDALETSGGKVSSGGQPGAGGALQPNGGQGGFPARGGVPGSQGGRAPTVGGEGGAGDSSWGEAGEAGMPEPNVTEAIWGKSFGDSHALQGALAMAVEPSGYVTVTGTLTGDVDFGQGVLSSSGHSSVFLAQLDSSGTSRWSAIYGGPGRVHYGFAIAVANDGALSVVGNFADSIDFGGGELVRGGDGDAFLASFDHDGTYRYAKSFGRDGATAATSVAVDSSGRPVIAGHFNGGVDLGGGAWTTAGVRDALLASFEAGGTYRWAQQAGDTTSQQANGLTRSTWDDSLFVAGQLQGSLKLGACSTVTSKGGHDVWLGWLDAAGNCLANRGFGDADDQVALAVATSKLSGNFVAVAGHFRGVLDIGTGQVKASQGTDAFIALFRANSFDYRLTPVWIQRIGGSGAQVARAVTFDSNDNLIVGGIFQGEDAVVGLRARGDSHDAFAVKYDLSGSLLWAKGFGDNGTQSIAAVGTDDRNNVYVAGTFYEQIALSSGTLQSAGHEDIFVAKLAP
jgi:hypothetical protein